MKYKFKNGQEIEVTEEDLRELNKMFGLEVDFEDMKEYYEELHKHAVQKMEHISERIITDEDSIDLAAEYVMKHGTAMDFIKFMRFARDYDISYHILESI
jgi:hypothetical protein